MQLQAEPADGEPFWQDKILQLKIWERKKKMIVFLEESEVQDKKSQELQYLTAGWKNLYQAKWFI